MWINSAPNLPEGWLEKRQGSLTKKISPDWPKRFLNIIWVQADLEADAKIIYTFSWQGALVFAGLIKDHMGNNEHGGQKTLYRSQSI